MQNLLSSFLRSEIEEIILSDLRLGARTCVLAAALLMLLLAAVGIAASWPQPF